MTCYLRSGITYHPKSEAALDVHAKLPAGNFIVRFNPQTAEFYYEQISDFPPLGKVYGNATARAARILNTYKKRAAATGVLLTGEKGSGKSMLAKQISILAYAEGIPTIIVNGPFDHLGASTEMFNKLIQSIEQECIVMFDEFEKTYDHQQQEKMLTLLDGVFPSKKLFLLTCNDLYRIDSNMRNRPGRIFYMIEFEGLEEEFIREYCLDTLKDQSQLDAVVRISQLYSAFNFDMLKAMIEEMNRYGETPKQVLELLNAKPTGDNGEYAFKLYKPDGGLIPVKELYPDGIWHGTPLGKENFTFEWYGNSNNAVATTSVAGHRAYDPTSRYDEPVSETASSSKILFHAADLKTVGDSGEGFVFVNDLGFRVTFTHAKPHKFAIPDAF